MSIVLRAAGCHISVSLLSLVSQVPRSLSTLIPHVPCALHALVPQVPGVVYKLRVLGNLLRGTHFVLGWTQKLEKKNCQNS